MQLSTPPRLDEPPPPGEGKALPEIDFDEFYQTHYRALTVQLCAYTGDLGQAPISDIARQEGVAEGTVKSWLHRGRTALAAHLTERNEETGRD